MDRPARMPLRNAAIVLRERAGELSKARGAVTGTDVLASVIRGHVDVAMWLDQLADDEMREEARALPPGDEQLEACRHA